MSKSVTYTNVSEEFPLVSDALLKALDEVFPLRDTYPSESLRDIDYHGGSRAVVNFLRHKNKIQNENILNS